MPKNPSHNSKAPVAPGKGGGNDVRLLLAQALAHFRAGMLGPANRLCDAALALGPDDVEALHLGGVVALQGGRFVVAAERLGRAARLRPADPGVLSDYGLALQRLRRLDDAEKALVEAVRLRPAFPEALVNLGNVLGDLGRDDDALACYRRAIELRPDFAEAHSNLALLGLRLGLRLEALAEANQALKLRPDMPSALQSLAQALNALGRYEEALAAEQRAIALRPNAGEPRVDLAQTQAYFGQLDAAAENFRAALRLEPGNGDWHRQLSSLVRHAERDADIAAMERLYKANATAPEDRMHVSFGLGKALDDIGAYDEAFDYFMQGNRLKRETFFYDSAESARRFAELRRCFTAGIFDRAAEAPASSPTPIFVLGMPRSGTSLIEQILATHPAIAGAGELPLLNRLVGSLGPGPGPADFAAILSRLDPHKLAQLAHTYLAYMRRLEPNAPFVVDKTPGNFQLIGMIRLMFPHARVIHCRRDAVDNSLSVFKTYFAAEGLRYAYDLAEIGRYHRLYLGLMQHWHEVLPGFVHDVSYEALVADVEGESRRLFSVVGLDWRPEALEFFNTRRPVQTASAAQVRQPIYSTSVGQAARYGDRLAPLLETLGETVTRP